MKSMKRISFAVTVILTAVLPCVYSMAPVSEKPQQVKPSSPSMTVSQDVEELIELLNTGSLAQKVHAEAELSKLGKAARPALKPLLSALESEEPPLRMGAAYTLGSIEDYSAVEPLIVSLDDSNSLVRVNAAWALENITGQSLGQEKQAWQDWWQKNKSKIEK